MQPARATAPSPAQGSQAGLDSERLREVTARLDKLLRREPDARLEITWKLRRAEKDGA